MISTNLVIALLVISIGCHFTIAIQCDFRLISDNDQPLNLTQHTTPSVLIGSHNSEVKKANKVFECEDPDGYETITDEIFIPRVPATTMISIDSREKPMDIDLGTRFGDDPYESVNECVSTKKRVQPQRLNTIYNTLMSVVNNATFIQLIEIDECQPKNEPCNNGTEPPIGKLILCRQKYVTIALKAIHENGTIVDEQFYYPSGCVCELVQKKTKN